MLNENFIVKKYEFDKPPIQKIDSIADDCIRDCHHKYFHSFDHTCVYDIIFTEIGNNETVIFTISDKSMASYESKKNNSCSWKWFYIYSNKQTNKTNYSNLPKINIHFHLKFRTPMMHRHFF